MSQGSEHFPLNAYEIKARNHALLCTIGFLILLPLGALLPRIIRTFTQRYVSSLSDPTPFTFWIYTCMYKVVVCTLRHPIPLGRADNICGMGTGLSDRERTLHWPAFLWSPRSTHLTVRYLISEANRLSQKIGLALLILYLIQLFVGLFIHFVKIPFFHGHRPPQNYFHAILGLAIIALAAYQVSFSHFLSFFVFWTWRRCTMVSRLNGLLHLVICTKFLSRRSMLGRLSLLYVCFTCHVDIKLINVSLW